ncbi:MAG: hydrolase [Spirochaetes bacterium]|nr:MAG: hydrolase [Spirochaetota bacterium]RKX93795.1 MAG: hydrolase [Spirochaetota bacterium]
MIPTREEALILFKKYNEGESLYRHALAVEAVMRHFAVKYGEDPEKWGLIGLIHDLDWEKWPDEHCIKTEEILKKEGWPEDWIRAVVSHGWGLVTEVEPELTMEKVLYTIDELTGLITATALMRPSKSLMDLGAKSVKKKWKDKRFSAGVNRELIDQGAAMLGIERTELIDETIAGMRTAAAELGLG